MSWAVANFVVNVVMLLLVGYGVSLAVRVIRALNVQHQLRTPLASTVGALRALRRNGVPPAAHDALLDAAQEGAENALQALDAALHVDKFPRRTS